MADSIASRCLLLFLGAALAGCAEFSHVNKPFDAPPQPPLRVERLPERATFEVQASRGNPRILFFLALSGGGSRAAVLSSATMLALQSAFDDVDLLREVDVISSVSGGSLPGAFYAASRDRALPLKGALAPLAEPAPLDKISTKLGRENNRLTCAGALAPSEQATLRKELGGSVEDARPVVELCAQADLTRLPAWDKETVEDLMTRNYLWRWLGNWFWPHNIARYWFTAFDRSDIMAKTLEDNLYDTPYSGNALTFRDLNSYRPYLIVNSTNATQRDPARPERVEAIPFGSVFTFTHDDFDQYLKSDIQQYPLSYAVMASSAFPLVFQNISLRDYRPLPPIDCTREDAEGFVDPDCHPAFLHVFDGGNSDNLGLRSIKRIVFRKVLDGSLDPDKDQVIVLLVDAFTTPGGSRRSDHDPRGLGSLFVDFNVVDAIDALLQRNRDVIIGEFRNAQLRWSDGDCLPPTRNLPQSMCHALANHSKFSPKGHVDLQSSLVFYHVRFADVSDEALRLKLNDISTSFTISGQNARYIQQAVKGMLTNANPCLQQIRLLVRGPSGDVGRARAACL